MGGQPHTLIVIALAVNGKDLQMELDTGAAISIISKATKEALFPEVILHQSDVALRTYTSETVPVIGEFDAHATYEQQSSILTLVVVEGSGPSLIGRIWLSKIQLNWASIKHTCCEQENLEALFVKYPAFFREELGTVVNFTATLNLKPGSKAKFCRPRPVPFALRDIIDIELTRLQDANIISKANYSDWAAPIVAVPKKDGKIRICGDY